MEGGGVNKLSRRASERMLIIGNRSLTIAALMCHCRLASEYFANLNSAAVNVKSYADREFVHEAHTQLAGVRLEVLALAAMLGVAAQVQIGSRGALMKAIRAHDLATVKNLVAQRADVNAKNDQGVTPIRETIEALPR